MVTIIQLSLITIREAFVNACIKCFGNFFQYRINYQQTVLSNMLSTIAIVILLQLFDKTHLPLQLTLGQLLASFVSRLCCGVITRDYR